MGCLQVSTFILIILRKPSRTWSQWPRLPVLSKGKKKAKKFRYRISRFTCVCKGKRHTKKTRYTISRFIKVKGSRTKFVMRSQDLQTPTSLAFVSQA